jgi:hypothetical protein
MANRSDLTISVELPDDHNADRLTIGPDGSVKVLDKLGNEIKLEKTERAIHYERPKGPKHQSQSVTDGQSVSISGLDELSQLSSFVAIDTNTEEINGVRVSAASFVVCKLIREKNGYRIESLDGCGHVYEFHNVQGNPEMLAILKVAHDTLKGRGVFRDNEVAFICDSDMDNHYSFSRREKPIYGDHYLPKGFFLKYASTDTEQELTNKLLRFCDTHSKGYLASLRNGKREFRTSNLALLQEDELVAFRYFCFPSLTISDSLILGVSLTNETTIAVQFFEGVD